MIKDTEIAANILERYTIEDFASVPRNVLEGAVRFINVLKEASDPGYTDYIKIVPYNHVSERDNKTAVCVIYEEVYEIAEKIQLGYATHMKEHNQVMDIQSKCDVFFEMYNHWSCGVYNERV